MEKNRFDIAGFDEAADRLFETGHVDLDRIALAHQFILQHREQRLKKLQHAEHLDSKTDFSKIDMSATIEAGMISTENTDHPLRQ